MSLQGFHLFLLQSSGRVGGGGRLFPKELHLKRERRRGGADKTHAHPSHTATTGGGTHTHIEQSRLESAARVGSADYSSSRHHHHSSHHTISDQQLTSSAGGNSISALGGLAGSQHQTAPRKVLLEQLSRMLPNENSSNPNSSTPLPDQITVVNMCDRQVLMT